MVRRDGRVSAASHARQDRAVRFPSIVDAAHRINASSFQIDGEAAIARDDGTPDFHALRSKRTGHEAVLFAFDLSSTTAMTCATCRYDGLDIVFRACLPHGAAGFRVEADGCALSRLLGSLKNAIKAVQGLARQRWG